MMRVVPVALLLAVSGCQAPEKLPIAPLPENGANIPFADILQRARLQAVRHRGFLRQPVGRP